MKIGQERVNLGKPIRRVDKDRGGVGARSQKFRTLAVARFGTKGARLECSQGGGANRQEGVSEAVCQGRGDSVGLSVHMVILHFVHFDGEEGA